MANSKINELDVYGDQVKEVLSSPPSSLFIVGNLIVFIFLLIVFFLTWLIQFPDVVQSEIELTTKDKPIDIISNIEGSISHLFIKDKDYVEVGDKLAVISNEVDYMNLLHLKSFLDEFNNDDFDIKTDFPKELQIGLLQVSLNELENVCNQYYSHLSILPEEKERRKIYRQRKQLLRLDKNLLEQERLYKKQLTLVKSNFRRQEKLYRQGVIAEVDIEKTRILSVEKERELENIKQIQIQNSVAIANLNRDYDRFKVEGKQKIAFYKLEIINLVNKLKAEITNWENIHIVKAKQKGNIAFLDYLEEGEYIVKETKLFTIVGENKEFIGQGYLPQNQSGKVKIGQDVIIKLSAFPEKEFGYLAGFVQDISVIPNNGKYLIIIEIPDGLKTNYGKMLPEKPRYNGSAEIVTEKLRLIERIFYELRNIFK